jgi:hypothetical protein
MSSPQKLNHKEEVLKQQIELMPEKYRKGLAYEISLAKKLKIDVYNLATAILKKKYSSGNDPGISPVMLGCRTPVSPSSTYSQKSRSSNLNR